MKKILKNALIIATAITIVSGCKPEDFGDINLSPNSPSTPQTYLLLTSAERYLGRTTAVTSTATAPGVINEYAAKLYTQQLSENLYTSESRYNTKVYSYNGIYNSPLQDLTTIINLNTDAVSKGAPNVIGGGSNANQIAAARILKAFYFQNMTDRWGDIPYSQALKGKEFLTPVFDKQQAVYTSLFKELKEAAAQFDSGATLKGDILFSGSVVKWKKFAATIRLNMALRLSKKDPATGRTEFNAAIADGVITSNADNVVYTHLAEAANENSIYYNYEVNKRYDYSISKTLVDAMNAINDPRIAVYADKTSAGTYAGMPYGLTQALAGASYNPGTVTSPGNVSLIGRAFRSQNSPVRIFTYPEVLLTIAEGYKLGWITGAPDDTQAAVSYNNAINASFTLNGVTAPANYFTQADVAYDSANGIKKIITQKWIANYMGYAVEAWSDWRRTGFPVLSPSPYPQNIGGKIPVRQGYTTDEASLNNANYQAVIASQGPDELNTPVWWNKP
ncbi:SusD/RagB family nutrient-binding outer membrane lipoprotein [Pedobacter jamesrossensis]|uniref:SusD/RagB family nutrient-binding outer membrane lipoprotein n=1 Tax=Pedobacter jamesrossensis TaxID=1908238 RepID=A0ABV8NQP7_9SPHI